MKIPIRLCLPLLALLMAVLESPARSAESPWQRVVVIGASASAGFVITEPLGGEETTRCKLNYYLDAAITARHAPVKNLASTLMFMDPEAFAPLQVAAVAKGQPTLVIGVDFLFWFCYGDATSDADRAARFELGLKLLEQIHCPLVVGDIPEVSYATNTGIISSAQVPSETARRAANQRLKAWAAVHPQVVVMPLARFMHDTMANVPLKLRGRPLSSGQTRTLLQADQLHPNPHGAEVLSLGVLDALVARQTRFPATAVRWDPEQVYRIGSQAADAARQAAEGL